MKKSRLSEDVQKKLSILKFEPPPECDVVNKIIDEGIFERTEAMKHALMQNLKKVDTQN